MGYLNTSLVLVVALRLWLLLHQILEPLLKARLVVVRPDLSGGFFKSLELFFIAHRISIARKANQLPTISFFGDSSSRDSEYMVLGGLAVSGHRIHEIEQRIADIRERGGIRSEFHWSKYRGGAKRKAYEELVGYAFELINKRHAALHLLATNFREFDHKRKPGQGKDTSINMLYWQICLHRVAGPYGKQRAIHIRLDAGNDCKDICGMRNQLCATAYKEHSTKPNCVRSIEAMDSEKSGLIQVSDVLIGAVASQLNGNLAHTPKGQLAEFVRKGSGLHSWSKETPASERFLTVWHYKGG